MSKNKPKIALLVPRFGILDRGAEVLANELAKRLSPEFDVTVYGRKRTGKDTHRSSLENINKRFKVVKVPSLTEYSPIANFFYNLHPKISKKLDMYFLNPRGIETLTFSLAVFLHLLFEKYDIIFPLNGIWGAITCRLIRGIRGTPFVYSSQGGIEPPIARQKPNMYFATNPEIYAWYNNYFPNLKTLLVPNGVDITKFRPGKTSVKIDLERPVYLCVAAPIKAKRLNLAVEAVSRLEKGSLLILGVGSLRKEVAKLGMKKLGRRRFLITDVSQDEIPSYYSAADVFTLPSKDEPFGIVYLEAMASGLPVAATNDRQRSYIIGNAGILCDVENIDEYAKVLEKASQTNFGSKPRKQAQKFSWKIISKKYKSAILKLTV